MGVTLVRRSWIIRLILYIVDAGLVNMGFFLAFRLRFGSTIPAANLNPFLQLIPYVGLLTIVLFWFFELYSPSWKKSLETLYSVIISVLIVNVATMALTFLIRGFAFPRSVFIIAALLQVFLLGGWRILWQHVIDRIEGAKRMIVIGTSGEGHLLAAKLGSLSGRRYNVVGIFDAHTEVAAACEAIPSAQVVCINPSLPKTVKEEIISRCLEEDKEVFLVPDVYDILLRSASVNRVDDLPIFQIESLSLTPGQQLTKRLFDLALALGGLVVSLPFMLLIAVAVKLSSPGPVFYLQKRVGINGKVFGLIKFRTMVADAEKHSGPVLATENDPRITRVGKVLRATRLDELPQLINVLKGDMSFVGPRPERPFFVEKFSERIPGYRYRLKVKPGITGLAQVQGKYDTDAADKLRYDLYYIRNYSPLLDLQIIFQTLRVMLMSEAARGTSEKAAVRADHAANTRGLA